MVFEAPHRLGATLAAMASPSVTPVPWRYAES